MVISTTDSDNNNQDNLKSVRGYVYKHIRLDTNIPFYIGIGTMDEGKYVRAYDKIKRNAFWKRIENKTKYHVEIIFEDLPLDELFEKEKYYIKLYGRRDKGTGTLVNMTDGGEGCWGIICSAESIEKRKNTMLDRYGVENPTQSSEIRDRAKQTNMKRYGVEYITQSEEFKDKIKQTNLAVRGVEYPSQSKEVREKIKQENLKNYGVEYVTQSSEIKDKIKKTNLEKYGVEYVSQSEKIRNKVKTTNLEKYGVENVFQNDEIKKKIKQSNLEKYGVEHPNQLESYKEKMRNRVVTDEIRKNMSKAQKSCKPVGQYKDGILIKEYPSITSTKLDGYTHSAVYNCCLGKTESYKGFEWRFI